MIKRLLKTAYFPWHGFIYIITTICKVGDKKQALESWELIQKTFEVYPKMVSDTRKPLHVALGNLLIKAWDATGHWVSENKSARTNGRPLLDSSSTYQHSNYIPDFITKLRSQRSPQANQKSAIKPNGAASLPSNLTRLAQTTAPGILTQTPMYTNGTPTETTISPDYSGSTMPDASEFSLYDISPEAWAEWDRLLANSQTIDISSEFQNPGNWSMYGGLD